MNRRHQPATSQRRTAITAAAAAVVAAAVVWVLPPAAAIGAAAAVLAVLASAAAVHLARLRRGAADMRARERAAAVLSGLAEDAPSLGAVTFEHRARKVRDALYGGFPDTAAAEADRLAKNTAHPMDERIALLQEVLAWHREERETAGNGRDLEFDVVIVSHFGLPGGNTSANAAEILAYRDAGLRVGLLQHPVFRWGASTPISDKIEPLIDGDRVVRIDARDRVHCALAVVRLPTVLLKPLEHRPALTADAVVIIANQTPFKFYGPEGPSEQAWDIATVEANLSDWLGDHTWYGAGPTVVETLLQHHAEEVADLKLAADAWFECIDAARWTLDGPRAADGVVRIGRHSRDHKLKWPEDPRTLTQCYPDTAPFEIHVLGGAEHPRRILGGLPDNWVEYEFNAMDSRTFLSQIDVLVYFISSEGKEAFGRAPLEAMAAGVPVVMDRVFEPTFGAAAVYCAPEEVAATVSALVADPQAYREQRDRALEHVRRHFSEEALIRRVRAHGVAVPPPS
ncbi:glycosyltransferase [Glycomyces terrestris]|uniref:Glycosyltransferase family 1 protein n=1 Tax=Glycomyces terrestris TaxID=2493553 RepID=A0A426USC9_9ACTN|nr:glycosyltransferase [Glycomyces terrestris]RRR96460.1 glycosyltransferase family 1 protein [Glycomyces terrestris]